MKHRLLQILLPAFLLLGACAPLLSALPAVIAAVTDGIQIIDMIEAHAGLALDQVKADDPTRKKVHEAITVAKAALNAALRAAQGAEQAGALNQESAEAAFANFKAAYLSLLEVVAPFGVSEAGDTLSARAESSGTTLRVPRPEAFRLQVARAK